MYDSSVELSVPSCCNECYAQVLGVVESCSVSRAFRGVKRYAAVVPPVVPHKGRTSVSGGSSGFGKSGNRPEDQGIHK
jgi:hypothetical protein